MSPSVSFWSRAIFGTDHGRVAPDQFRDRVRRFLQPAVVGEAAVPGRRAGIEADFDSRPPPLSFRPPAPRPVSSRRRVTLIGSTVFEAATTPSCSALRQACSLSPVNCASQIILDDVVGLGELAGGHPRHDLRRPSCRRTSARSSAAESRPALRRSLRRPRIRANALRGMCQFAAAAVSSSSAPR